MRRVLCTALVGALLVSCSHGDDAEAPDQEGKEAVQTAAFERQVQAGQTLYGHNCASCHGDAGQGAEAPRLVGLSEGALPLTPRPNSARKSHFETVADVATFVVESMPPGGAGKLTADEYWSILAFDLYANGIKLDQQLTPELALNLTIPR